MSSTLPQVDVVILSWNRLESTIATIENILQQKTVQPQLWIVDQGSEAAQLTALTTFCDQYANVHLDAVGQNLGVPGGRNRGMQAGTAPYIVIIDNDAIFDSDHALADIVAGFEADPKLGALGLRILNYTTREDDRLSWVYPRSRWEVRDQSFQTTRFVGCGHAIRRAVLSQTQGYDDKLFFFWEEVDLSMQMIQLGYTLTYDASIVVLHKVSPELRYEWGGNRFYYLVRNAMYLNYKYHRSIPQLLVLMAGYIVKGLRNRLPGQTLRGQIDGIRMLLTTNLSIYQKLDEAAKDYLYEHEIRYRGSFWQRVRREVLEQLSTRSTA